MWQQPHLPPIQLPPVQLLSAQGDCVLYSRSLLGKVFGQAAASFSFEKFRYLCIMAGECGFTDEC